jgi:hypothetical protein
MTLEPRGRAPSRPRCWWPASPSWRSDRGVVRGLQDVGGVSSFRGRAPIVSTRPSASRRKTASSPPRGSRGSRRRRDRRWVPGSGGSPRSPDLWGRRPADRDGLHWSSPGTAKDGTASRGLHLGKHIFGRVLEVSIGPSIQVRWTQSSWCGATSPAQRFRCCRDRRVD